MGQSSLEVAGLARVQFKTFKLNISAACRKMTTDQILELADHLHAMIRRRSACGRSAMTGHADRHGCNADLLWERPQ